MKDLVFPKYKNLKNLQKKRIKLSITVVFVFFLGSMHLEYLTMLSWFDFPQISLAYK